MVTTWLLLAIVAIGVALAHYGHLKPVVAFLDSEALTFAVGKVHISAYKLLKGIIAVVILFWFAATLSHIFEKYLNKLTSIRASNRALLLKAIQIIIYFLAFLLTLDVLGIDLTALAIFSGAVGIGVGFGLQKITSNFISGLILLFEKSIEIDDLIEMSGGIFGYIRQMGARYTLIETFDGREIITPNEDFITNRVTNWTYSKPNGRIEIPVGIAYGSDLRLALKLMLETAKEHPRCSKEPEPEAFVREFAENTVKLILFFWVDDVTVGRFGPQSDVMVQLVQKFKDHGIEIPIPQREMHLKYPEELARKKSRKFTSGKKM